ncbi:MAG: SUMF1/EgtB/PvdO family nonheme iron enzyme [Gammaproteobacteria bacterium]
MIWSSAIDGKASIVTGSISTLARVGNRLLVKPLILALCGVGQVVVPAEAADPELEVMERQLKVLEEEEAASRRAAEEKERQAREESARRTKEYAKERDIGIAERARVTSLAGKFAEIQAGTFEMGCSPADTICDPDEKPRKVTVAPFKIALTEVTFALWDACAEDDGCDGYQPPDEGWGRGERPVIIVSYSNIESFLTWINRKTGKRYRLPTEEEWEYAARGGAQTRYWWGNSASHEHANYGADECCEGFAMGRDRWVKTSPVGQFPANNFGLHDMLGNVWEWTSSCYQKNCKERVIRGGSWDITPAQLRVSYRFGLTPHERGDGVGFRLVEN